MNAVRIRKIVSASISTLLFVVLIVMVLAVVSSKASGGEPQFFGYQLKSVLSGSMEPTFLTGSIIAVRPVDSDETFKKGDIITFLKSDGSIVTHRIINVIDQGGQYLYETKGDNNEEPDSEWTMQHNIVGKYTGFTIPYVGYFVDFANSARGTAILLIVPGVLLVMYAGFTLWKAIAQLELRQREDPHTEA